MRSDVLYQSASTAYRKSPANPQFCVPIVYSVPWKKALSSLECGTPEWIRTTDLLLRRQTLYPAELRALNKTCSLIVCSGSRKRQTPVKRRSNPRAVRSSAQGCQRKRAPTYAFSTCQVRTPEDTAARPSGQYGQHVAPPFQTSCAARQSSTAGKGTVADLRARARTNSPSARKSAR
jgi:hypothetical protein